MDSELLKDVIYKKITNKRELLAKITEYLYRHPEIGGEETQAVAFLGEILRKAGFNVEIGLAQLPTSFVGIFNQGRRTEPKVAFIVEYDALPSLGHACGHNASAAASIGAAVVLKEVMEEYTIPGACMAVGTPGEENMAGKVPMIEAGVFEGVSAAMMAHAYDRWIMDSMSMALDSLEFSFTGKPAHGAVAPHEGVNALDGVMLTFHGINCLRQHILDGSRIHGIVTQGGDAPNIVPEKARARYYVRSQSSQYLEELTEKAKNCARGAALATGCKLEIGSFEHHMDNLSSNKILLNLFSANLSRWVDTDKIIYSPETLGSTDMGNLSHVVPSIHPLMPIAPEGINVHTHEFAKSTISSEALDTVFVAASAMACTSLDILLNDEILKTLK